MNSQEIVDYVMNTPNNTNPVILKQMIDANSTGGVTSWNDLTDKPFGKEFGKIQWCNEELYFDEHGRSYSFDGGALVLGQEYTVVIDGQEYKTIAKEDPVNECVVCGNTTLWEHEDFSASGEDTGEPFVFANRWNADEIIEACFANTLPDVVWFTLSAYGEIVTKIPEEYLPEDVFVRNGDSRFGLRSPSGNLFYFMVNDDGELVPWEK